MSETLTIQGRVHLGRRRDRGPQEATDTALTGRVPRVARLMALAIRFEGLLSAGTVRNYSQIAKLGHVTRARVTQVMNLRALAPDIQEALLFLPRVERGRDPIHLAQLQPLAKLPLWSQQRALWGRLQASMTSQLAGDHRAAT